MHSSSFGKPHAAFYLNELLTALMNISFFFMEAFNGPNRGNDILSSDTYLQREEGDTSEATLRRPVPVSRHRRLPSGPPLPVIV